MSLKDIIMILDQLIPILATLTNDPAIAGLAQQLIKIANDQLANQAAATGKTTEQLLAEASAAWDKALANAEDLRSM